MAKNNDLIVIDGDALLSCCESIKSAYSTINSASSSLSSGNKYGQIYQTGIGDCVSKVKGIQSELNQLYDDYQSNSISLLSLLHRNQEELLENSERNLVIVNSSGEEYVVDKNLIDATLAQELLLKYTFLDDDSKNYIEKVADGSIKTLNNRFLSIDIVDGKVTFDGKKIESWHDFLNLVNEYGSPQLKAYFQEDTTWPKNEELLNFAAALKEMTSLENGGDSKLTSYELALAFGQTTLLGTTAYASLEDLQEAYFNGEATLFQANRSEDDILTLNQLALESGYTLDIKTIEAISLMYLYIEEPSVASMIDYDNINNEFAVETDYQLELEGKINTQTSMALFEAYYAKDILGGRNSGVDFTYNFYLKEDVMNDANYEYDSYTGTYNFKGYPMGYYELSLVNPELADLLNKDYASLTAEEIETLRNSEYCIGLDPGIGLGSSNKAFIDLGENAELQQRYLSILENKQIGMSLIEETTWHTLVAKSGTLNIGEYQIYEIKVDEDSKPIALRISPDGESEQWVYLEDVLNNSNITLDSEMTKIIVNNGTVSLYGNEDNNFITFLNSLSGGAWVNRETGFQVTSKEANEILRLFKDGQYEDAFDKMRNLHCNIYGTDYDKNALEYLQEKGYTIEAITSYRNSEEDNNDKPVWHVFFSSAGQAGMYTVGGVAGFFENIWDGAVSGLGWALYAPVDLFQQLFGNTESINETYNNYLKKVEELEAKGYFYEQHTLEEVAKEIFGYDFSPEFYEALRSLEENVITKNADGTITYSEEFQQYLQNYGSDLVGLFNDNLGGISHHEKSIDQHILDVINNKQISIDAVSLIYNLIPESTDQPLTYDTDSFGNKVLSNDSLLYFKDHVSSINYTNETLQTLMATGVLESYLLSPNNSDAITLSEFLFSKAYNDAYMDESMKYANHLKEKYVGDENFEYLDENSVETRYTEHLYFIMALDIMNSTNYSNMIRQSVIKNKELVSEEVSVFEEYGEGKIGYLRKVDEIVEYLVKGDLSYEFAHMFDDTLNEYGALEGTMLEGVFTSIGEMVPMIAIIAVSGGTSAPAFLQPSLIFSSAYGKTFESTYYDPRFESATLHQRFGYSVISGAIEAAVEQAGIGGSAFGGLDAMDAFKAAFKDKTAKSWVNAFFNLGWSSSMEGVEEIISGFCEPFNAFIVMHQDATILQDDLGNYFVDGEFVNDFLSGFAAAGIMNMGGITINRIANSLKNNTFDHDMKKAYDASCGLTLNEWMECARNVAELMTKTENGDHKASTLIKCININSELIHGKIITLNESVQAEIKAVVSAYQAKTDIKTLYDTLSVDARSNITLAEFSNILMNRSIIADSVTTDLEAISSYNQLSNEAKSQLEVVFEAKMSDILKKGSQTIFELFRDGYLITNEDGATTKINIRNIVPNFDTWNAICNHFVTLNRVLNLGLDVKMAISIQEQLNEALKNKDAEGFSLQAEYEGLSMAIKDAGLTYQMFEALYNEEVVNIEVASEVKVVDESNPLTETESKSELEVHPEEIKAPVSDNLDDKASDMSLIDNFIEAMKNGNRDNLTSLLTSYDFVSMNLQTLENYREIINEFIGQINIDMSNMNAFLNFLHNNNMNIIDLNSSNQLKVLNTIFTETSLTNNALFNEFMMLGDGNFAYSDAIISISFKNGSVLTISSVEFIDLLSYYQEIIENLKVRDNLVIKIGRDDYNIILNGITYQFNQISFIENFSHLGTLSEIINNSDLTNVTNVSYNDDGISITYEHDGQVNSITIDNLTTDSINNALEFEAYGESLKGDNGHKVNVATGIFSNLLLKFNILSNLFKNNPFMFNLLSNFLELGLLSTIMLLIDTNLIIVPLVYSGYLILKSGTIVNLVNRITSFTNKVTDNIVKWGNSFIDGINQKFNAILEIITKFRNSKLGKVIIPLGSFALKIGLTILGLNILSNQTIGGFTTLDNIITSEIKVIVTSIVGVLTIFNNIVTFIGNKFTSLINSFKTRITNRFDSIKNGVTNWFNGIKEDVVSNFKNLFSKKSGREVVTVKEASLVKVFENNNLFKGVGENLSNIFSMAFKIGIIFLVMHLGVNLFLSTSINTIIDRINYLFEDFIGFSFSKTLVTFGISSLLTTLVSFGNVISMITNFGLATIKIINNFFQIIGNSLGNIIAKIKSSPLLLEILYTITMPSILFGTLAILNVSTDINLYATGGYLTYRLFKGLLTKTFKNISTKLVPVVKKKGLEFKGSKFLSFVSKSVSIILPPLVLFVGMQFFQVSDILGNILNNNIFKGISFGLPIAYLFARVHNLIKAKSVTETTGKVLKKGVKVFKEKIKTPMPEKVLKEKDIKVPTKEEVFKPEVSKKAKPLTEMKKDTTKIKVKNDAKLNPEIKKVSNHKLRNTFIAFLLAITSIPIFVYVFDKDEELENKFYLSLYGHTSIELPLGNLYQEPGYYAYDTIDGYITEQVLVKGDVNYQKLGIYTITYTVTNSRNEKIEKIRTVKVVNKKTANEEAEDIKVIETKKVYTGDGNPIYYSMVDITLNDFNEQIEKGKVYDGINIKTTQMLNQYINKLMLQNRLVYAVSLTSIVKNNNQYASIYACNKNYVNQEASGMIVTNGTLERVYNSDNNCFANYGVFYFTSNKLNYTKINNDTNQKIIDSKTRNTFVYQDVIVDNSVIINNSEMKTSNNAICQSSSNTLKIFSFDKEVSYQELGQLMLSNKCQTGLLLTNGDTFIYKSQYSSTLNIQHGTDNYSDSLILFYQKNKSES